MSNRTPFLNFLHRMTLDNCFSGDNSHFVGIGKQFKNYTALYNFLIQSEDNIEEMDLAHDYSLSEDKQAICKNECEIIKDEFERLEVVFQQFKEDVIDRGQIHTVIDYYDYK